MDAIVDRAREAFLGGDIAKATSIFEQARVGALKRQDLAALEALLTATRELQAGSAKLPRSWRNLVFSLQQNVAYLDRIRGGTKVASAAAAATTSGTQASEPQTGSVVPVRSPKKRTIFLAVAGGLVLIVIVIAVSSGHSKKRPSKAAVTSGHSKSPPTVAAASATASETVQPPRRKAANGDDITDLHSRAQQAVNRAEVCLAALAIAGQDTSSPGSMATSLQKARSICNESRSYLATNNTHGFSDQNTELFGAADEAKSATNAGLAYLDTQYPSKLADFTNHIESAQAAYQQGLSDLDARLAQLGVPKVKG